jgi:hypothetical protein
VESEREEGGEMGSKFSVHLLMVFEGGEKKRDRERNGEEWCQVVWYGMAGFPLGHAMKKQMIESKQDMHASHVLVLVMVTKMVA